MIAAPGRQFTMKVRRLTEINPFSALKAELATRAQQRQPALTEADEPASVASKQPRRTKANKPDASAPATKELDDAELFRSLIGPVREMAPVDAPVLPEAPAPRAAMSEADEAHVIEELFDLPDDIALLDGAEQMSYLADGHSPKLLRKLKRAQFRICDEFDLHHLTAPKAKRLLHQYLHQMRAQQRLCVLVIHGKGLRSNLSGALLKSMVDLELRRRNDVIAFHSAPPAQGGTGAVMILLKAPTRN